MKKISPRLGSAGLMLAGVLVFAVASLVQSIGDSSMFESKFRDPDNPVKYILLQMTWWPGWVVSVGLVLLGLIGMFTEKDR